MKENILRFISQLIYGLWDLVARQFKKLARVFTDANIYEKIIVFMTVLSLLAVVMAMGRYRIFDTWFYINNPLAVYMIGIVAFMLLTVYLQHVAFTIARVLLNLYHLVWVVIIHFGQGIIKAPYELTAGYYLNLLVPVIYIVLSALSQLVKKQEHHR